MTDKRVQKLAEKLFARFTPYEQAEIAIDLEKYGHAAVDVMIEKAKCEKVQADDAVRRVRERKQAGV